MEALMEVGVPIKFDQVTRNREELVLALRSGRYPQCCKSYFGKDNSVCFLGLIMKLLHLSDVYEDKATPFGLVLGDSISLMEMNYSLVFIYMNREISYLFLINPCMPPII